jgi:fatty acid desaturase
MGYNLAFLTLTWSVVFAGLTVFWLWPTWYTFGLAFVLTSSRQQALLNIEHECIHGTFVKGRHANRLIGMILCAAPCASPFETSKARHLTHHRLLATADDPDLPLHGREGKTTRPAFIRHFALGLLGGYAVMVLLGGDSQSRSADDRRRALVDLSRIVGAQLALWAATTVLFSWWVYLALWAIPLATLTAFFHLVRSFGEHAVLEAERPEHDNLLISVVSNRVERFLVAPYFMNFHSEHHLFPWIPAPRLPAARRRLVGNAAAPPLLLRRSYLSALRSWFRELARLDRPAVTAT